VRRILRPGGVAVCNTLDEAAEVRAALAARFARLVRVEIDDYENQIFVASDGPLGGAMLRGRVVQSPVLAPSLRALRLRTLSSARPGSAARPR
jgi:hypothetical protein